MKIVKAFAAGVVFPAILIPLVLFLAKSLGRPEVLNLIFIHTLLLVWGLWNILHVLFFRWILPTDLGYLVSGAILGVLVAVIGVFYIKLPTILGFPPFLYYAPLFIIPVIYAFLWLYIVKPLNRAIL